MESVVGLSHCQLQLASSLAALETDLSLFFRGCIARAPMHMTPKQQRVQLARGLPWGWGQRRVGSNNGEWSREVIRGGKGGNRRE